MPGFEQCWTPQGENEEGEHGEGSCPHCGEDVHTPKLARGRAFRCGSCQAWLFRQIWTSGEAVDRCQCCSSPMPGGQCCVMCGFPKRRLGFFGRGIFPLLRGWLNPAQSIRQVEVNAVRADSFQPRLSIDVAEYEALRRSLDQVGMIQPLILRCSNRKSFAVVCGHRRLLAARQLGWTHIPARVLRIGEVESLRIRISENLHREQVSPLELAEALERYFLVTQSSDRAELSSLFGIEADQLTELLSLLKAPPEVREDMIYGLNDGSVARPTLRSTDQLESIERKLGSSGSTVRPLS